MDITGFQLVAASALQQGEGLSPPNITANYTAYKRFSPVANYSNIFYHARDFSGISSNNANLLISIGANSFPQIFGQVPYVNTNSIGPGPLIDIAYVRTEHWFGNSATANVFVQVLSQAQNYAATSQAILSSAVNAQWSGGPQSSITGGFSAIAGSDPVIFSSVANAIQQLGTLMIPNDPKSGFSNAACFQQILDSGDNTIGNLNLTFFGKTITDPITGNTLIIDSNLFSNIISNPVGNGIDDSFQIAALNPLDIALGIAANQALTNTGDLDAVVTFFQVGSTAASNIYQWTDCLTLPIILGSIAANAIAVEQKLGDTPLSAYYFIKALITNITNLTSLTSMSDLGFAMSQLTPLANNTLTMQTVPLSQDQISDLQASFGPGSGNSGNPTVNDILGSTDYNNALSQAIIAIQPLTNSIQWKNISSDTFQISNILINNSYPPGGVTLTNGQLYNNINDLSVGGSSWINQNATALSNIAPSLTDISLFDNYNALAITHNNSSILTSSTGKIPLTATVNNSNSTNFMNNLSQVYGLTGVISGLIGQLFSSNPKTKIGPLGNPAVYLNTPGPPASLTTTPIMIANAAANAVTDPTTNETTGLSLISNCIDNSTLGGQALTASIIESKNSQALTSAGL